MPYKVRFLNPNKELQAYIIGLAIGDGNLSLANGRTPHLRITCDKKYPLLMQRIIDSLHLLLPENKVGVVNRKGCCDVSIYSTHLEHLLGWKAGKGSKFVKKVSIPMWIWRKKIYKINCLKGLIETDGSIYNDRGYKMMMFVTIIPKLAKDFYEMVSSLGFKPHTYKLTKQNNYLRKRALYHIRLSKDVNNFLSIIKPEK